jgi:hypothetical protein
MTAVMECWVREYQPPDNDTKEIKVTCTPHGALYISKIGKVGMGQGYATVMDGCTANGIHADIVEHRQHQHSSGIGAWQCPYRCLKNVRVLAKHAAAAAEALVAVMEQWG